MTEKDAAHTLNALAAAEALCARRGVRLTRLRRMILEILVSAASPLKAYEIIDIIRDTGKKITPASLYRTLEFLLQYGLAHRVNLLNAYIFCMEEQKHNPLMFVCSICNKTEEIHDPVLDSSIQARLGELGLALRDGGIEIQGKCRECSAKDQDV
jgi:Fur family zinc uptake transcriptional regulator